MILKRNPETLRAVRWKELIRTKLLSRHLQRFKHSERTLDLGCGWGFSLAINPQFWLVDADKNCVDYLRSKSTRVFLADLAQLLPFEDSFFENVFTHDVLEHLERDEIVHMFHETRRITQTGGTFMNVVPNMRGYLYGLRPDIGHKTFIDAALIRGIAEQTGFELDRVYRSPLKTGLSELFKHNKLVTICRAV